MSSNIAAAIPGFISAVLISLISHFLLIKKERKIRLQALQSRLHDEQLDAYKCLWSALEPTSRFSSSDTITLTTRGSYFINKIATQQFINNIRSIFFSESGLFLSRQVRKELFSLLDQLTKEIRKEKKDTNISISQAQYHCIRSQIQVLIETIRRDIGLSDLMFPEHLDDY